jgi:2,4-dienoyl-CoA reductase-like NADH-dependent reductase (Old Yellow Enzyme family)
MSRSVFEPVQLGPLTLRNRIIKAATFEGVMPRGAVSDELVEFHRQVAAGGAAMTTVAYCAIAPGGRVHRDTLVMDRATLPGLRRLVDAVHAEGAAAAAQLGHAGLVANTRSNRMPTLAPSTRISAPAMGLVRGASRAQLDAVVQDFVRATQVAAEAGFDCIEVHLGHNYLLSSFFSPNLNRRRDEYGGSLANRAAFPRRVVQAIREAAPPHLAVIAKLNMADGVPKGLWLDESLPIASMLETDGHLDAIELTGGSSLLNGMYFFRGDVPMREFIATQPKAVGLGLRVMGRRIFPHLPFEEAFFLPFARQFRAALDLPLILLGGINRLDTMTSALDEGFELVAMARALLREPDLPRRLQGQEADAGLCVHCNKCLPTIYTGTRCVLAGTGS